MSKDIIRSTVCCLESIATTCTLTGKQGSSDLNEFWHLCFAPNCSYLWLAAAIEDSEPIVCSAACGIAACIASVVDGALSLLSIQIRLDGLSEELMLIDALMYQVYNTAQPPLLRAAAAKVSS